MIRALFLLLASASPALAETARVLSGEHDTFTRLVIELPAPEAWTLGRSESGYVFAADTKTQPEYDLSGVWQRIPRTRLGSVDLDVESGALMLGLACNCYIFPFEYQPGIVVLDIKAGPAPSSSAFEAPFELPGAAGPTVNAEGGAKPYDWLARRITGPTSPAPALPLPLATGTVSLDPLRDALLEQIARGAAEGVVDMELPGRPRDGLAVDHAVLPWSTVRIGEEMGITITDPDAVGEGSLPQHDCADPSQLDISGWGGAMRPPDILAASRSDLYGEFDLPEPEAIRHSVRLLLYLGFGVEALQTADLAGNNAPDETLALYRSMALLVDGETDPQTPFADMLQCDGPAALWSALAHDRLPAGSAVNRDAILQAFVALPAHLRRHLGPALAAKFLKHDDADAARLIRDAMDRAPATDRAAVALLDARAELHDGNPEAAQAHAEAAVALDGDKVESLVALVETHFHTLDPLSPDIAEALLSLRDETDGTAAGSAVDRAIVLALALSGQIGAAFTEPAAKGAVSAELWRVTQDRASDDDFLVQAVLPAGSSAPAAAPEVRQAIAKRLLSLGFPDAAQIWIGSVSASDPTDRRMVAATAAFMQGDARAALALIEGLEGPEPATLRAKALLQLGNIAAAETAMAASGNTEATARLGTWKGDWGNLDPDLPDPWLQTADLAAASATEAPGLLGRGGDAVEASLATRQAIGALLSSVASPLPGGSQ